jgi:hypothetical protein
MEPLEGNPPESYASVSSSLLPSNLSLPGQEGSISEEGIAVCGLVSLEILTHLPNHLR